MNKKLVISTITLIIILLALVMLLGFNLNNVYNETDADNSIKIIPGINTENIKEETVDKTTKEDYYPEYQEDIIKPNKYDEWEYFIKESLDDNEDKKSSSNNKDDDEEHDKKIDSNYNGNNSNNNSTNSSNSDNNNNTNTTEPNNNTETPSKYLENAKREADWIVSAQKSSGTITVTPSSNHIMPYYSNLAMESVAMLDGYQKEVKEYMTWYFNSYNKEPDNLNTRGTIYDYIIIDGVEIPEYINDPEEKNYDSSDSYAATFLSLAKTYYETYSDEEFILEHLEDLKIISSAIDATMQPDGLTFAKPDYHAAYLMDNTEVWRGYYDFALLLKDIGDDEADLYFKKAEDVSIAIDVQLWNEDKQGYNSELSKELDWNNFYPDARANMRMLLFGIPNTEDKIDLIYHSFISNHPDWITLEAGDTQCMAMSVGTAVAKDYNTLNSFLENIETQIMPDKDWPWKISESGYYIRTLLILENVD